MKTKQITPKFEAWDELTFENVSELNIVKRSFSDEIHIVKEAYPDCVVLFNGDIITRPNKWQILKVTIWKQQ